MLKEVISIFLLVFAIKQFSLMSSSEESSKSSAANRPLVNPHPFPTYFVSHGGPTFMYESDPFGDKGAWNIIRNWGTAVKTVWKPDYLIVVSAHFQSHGGTDAVEIAVPPVKDGENDLIYDFYGFPKHMYEETFFSRNLYNVSKEIERHLIQNGFKPKLTERGIDHGVWVPLKVAFGGDQGVELPDIPLVQVSLLQDETDFDAHYKLGKTLDYFRKNLIWDESQQRYLKGAVICSGMSVHNLRDIQFHTGLPLLPRPYTAPFSELLYDSFCGELEPQQSRFEKVKTIQLRNLCLLQQAHPTVEHFIPLVVALGMDDKVERIYNSDTGSLAWGIYRFGEAYDP